MVNTFFAILLFCVACALMAKFLSWCLAAKRVRYGDWAAEQKRLNLLNNVQQVREEQGDYARPAAKKAVRSVPNTRRAVRRK